MIGIGLQKNIDKLLILKGKNNEAYCSLYERTILDFGLAKYELNNLLKYPARFEKLRLLRRSASRNDNVRGMGEYKKAFEGFCRDYNISEKTLYRYLKSDTAPRRPVKRADKGYPKKDYNRIKKANITKQKNKMNKDFKKFLSEYFDLENPPADELKVKINKLSFLITKEDAGDIVLILTNAYNRWQKHNELDLPLDRDLLREQMLMHLFESQMRVASEVGDIKSIESLTRIYDRMKPQSELDTNFAVFEKCMRDVRPGITKEEIISLIKKNS